ncbi:MAG: hypothetical protein SFW36_21805 [Leptolyngbyaceae cyanobacterium bins.59]|nr:hypothetical protein [Leptolyngbyaceae cyanobacterium bins.59]
MFSDLLPFPVHINTIAIAGTSLWSLALYLGFSPVSDWFMEQLSRWFNYAERSLYLSQEEFEKTRLAREAQNSFYASLLSIVPFMISGFLCNFGVEWGLGKSWAVSMGILACVVCGVYELGRRDGRSN